MNFINNALDFIFPPSCGICGKIGEGYLCGSCYQEIQKYLFDNKSENLKFHILKYDGIVRDKMIEYKFNDKSYLYRMFCEIVIRNEKACDFLKQYDMIIPVPLHKKRKKMRGYNQSELIAKQLAYQLHIPINTNILKKTTNTIPQSCLNRMDRMKNIQNVYNLENGEKIIGKTVIIIDDIHTTGATTNECKKVLQMAKPKKIGIMTIAKG